MALTIACYSFDDPAYACARLRVLEPVRALKGQVCLEWGAVPRGAGHALRTDILETADLVLIQRHFPSPDTAPLLAAIRASGKPVVYDTDDDWTQLPADHPFRPGIAARLPYILETARQAALVTTSTPVLARVFAALASRVAVLPNFLPRDLWRPVTPPERPVTAVGLAGTPSHGPDLAPLEPALAAVARRLGERARWVFFGYPPATGRFPGATSLPFTPDYGAYAARLPRLGLGIGLAPLADTAFNRAKSPVKWLEYAACGLAGIFADLPPYNSVVEQERTGILLGPEPKDWGEAVARLVRDAGLRRRLARQAQETVFRDHTLPGKADGYLQAWHDAMGG